MRPPRRRPARPARFRAPGRSGRPDRAPGSAADPCGGPQHPTTRQPASRVSAGSRSTASRVVATTWVARSTRKATTKPRASTTTVRERRLRADPSRASRLARSSTGISVPRRSITPSMTAGASGRGVIAGVARISRTCAMGTAYRLTRQLEAGEIDGFVDGARVGGRSVIREPHHPFEIEDDDEASAGAEHLDDRSEIVSLGRQDVAARGTRITPFTESTSRPAIPSSSPWITTMRLAARLRPHGREAEPSAQVDHLDDLAPERARRRRANPACAGRG